MSYLSKNIESITKYLETLKSLSDADKDELHNLILGYMTVCQDLEFSNIKLTGAKKQACLSLSKINQACLSNSDAKLVHQAMEILK